MKAKNGVLGGVLLLGGTCIGAGMLGLPVSTAAAGFYPTIGAFLLVWFFMTCSALAYLEVSLRFKGETNLISIAGRTMGHVPKVIAFGIFVLFLYSLMAAYTSGGTTMLAHIIGFDIKGHFHLFMMAILFAAPFALLVYFGTLWVDRVNQILMFGFITAFIAMCVWAFNSGPAVHINSVGESKYLLFTFPLLVSAFGYQTLIPTLKTYLQEDVRKLRLTIIVGGLLPLLVYAVWELIILNLIPTWGESGLVHMLNSGVNPADAMTDYLTKYGEIFLLFEAWFTFFALTTSFMGVGLGITHFFEDALKFGKTSSHRIILVILTFVPPIFYTLIYPQGFLVALSYAGVFASILLIIYPVLMAWSARYVRKLPGVYQMPGGKILLLLTLLFGVFVIVADIMQQMGVFPIPHV